MNVGATHLGVAKTAALTLTNTAAVNASYTETLSSNGFSGVTGSFTAAGAVSGIAGGGSSAGTLLVGLGGGLAAGHQTGTAMLALNSNEVNSSGLGTTALPAQTVTITGDVYRYAAAAAAQTVSVGAFHVGTAKTAAVTLTNTAAADATYTETLLSNGFSGTSANFTTAGSASGIIGGGNSSGTLLVGVGTALGAGLQSGTTTLALQSNAVNGSGLGTTSIGNQTITITAAGYNLAATSFSTTSAALAVIHVGDSFTAQSLTIGNTLTGGTYNETLGAAFANASGVTTSGGPISVAAGAAANSSLTVNLTDTTVGHKSGSVDVQFNSQEVNSSGLGTTSLTALNKTITVTGDVFTGTGVWSGASSAWASNGNWSDTNGVQAAPGTFVGYDNVDAATFNGSGTATVSLNATTPSLKTLTFYGATAYTITQGTGSASLQFKSDTGTATLMAGSTGHTISAPVILASNLAATVTNGGDILTISGSISGSGNLTKNGLGTLVLSGANGFTGDTMISGGTLTTGIATALQNSTLNYDNQGGTLSFGALTAAALGGLKGAQNLALTNTNTAAVALTVGGNGQDTSYAGILSGAGSLVKLGIGTLILSGTNTFGGDTVISGGTLTTGTAMALQNSTLNYQGGAFSFGTLTTATLGGLKGGQNLALLNTSGKGVNLSVGNNNASTTYTGILTGTNSAAKLTKIGSGTLTLDPGALATGTVANVTVNAGTLALNSGTLTVSTTGTPTTGATGFGLLISTGTLVVAGGSVNTNGYVSINGGGKLVVSGGTLTNATEILFGYGCAGTVTLSGSGVMDLNILRISQASGGTVNLDGGTLRLKNFGAGADGTGVVNFNGTTVQAKASTTTFTPAGAHFYTWNVLAGGAKFDTAGYDITIPNALQSGTANDGGLTKTGAGTLILSGANTYNGVTTVNAGTLLVNGGGSINANVNGLMSGTGTLTNLAVNSGEFSPGEFAVASTTLATGTVSWTAGGKYTWDLASGDGSPANDLFQVTGKLDLTSLSSGSQFIINVNGLAGLNTEAAWNDGIKRTSWVIATASDGILDWTGSNQFLILTNNVDTSKSGGYTKWYMSMSGNNLMLNYVPEPGTMSLLLLGVLALFGRRRRR